MSTKLRYRTFEPATVTLRGGSEVRLRIKRLDIGEHATFERAFARAQQKDADRLLTARRPGDEQERVISSAIDSETLQGYATAAAISAQGIEKREDVSLQAVSALQALIAAVTPTERFVVPDEEIRRRRYLDLTDAERIGYERLERADQEAFETCMRDALTDFVRVEPGQIELEDPDTGVVTDVTTGAQLAQCLGSDIPALVDILLTIRAKNRLTGAEKNGSGSPSISTSSSNECDPTAPGASPAGTAAPAAPSASAMTAAATPTAASPSGSTMT